ncbi:MAG: KamA family radical SAM protein [Halobacteriovoraceae bacterium]|nr:KamA family radical SAM protein [Halobacteriovoraceae bacterium]
MSWQKELREAYKSIEELSAFLNYPIAVTPFPILIPRPLAQKIKLAGPDSALWKQFVPDLFENDPQGMADPIGDRPHQRAPRVIHRYTNRALLLVTNTCPVHCRYCFRQNELSPDDVLFNGKGDASLQYLRENPQIEEVILSGGDPLILSNSKLDQIFTQLANIDSIRYLRFHSRMPVIIPGRVDGEFSELIKKWSRHFQQISFVVHLNHNSEIDSSVEAAFERLNSLPLQLMSQSVLLRGVNDSLEDLLQLFKKLIAFKIRPLYLHHPDQVRGGMHFTLPLEKGRRIYRELRNLLPGWAIPQYVVDLPDGGGKTEAYNPEGLQFSGNFLDRHLRDTQFIDRGPSKN